MEIAIPLHLLFSVFGEGVSYMKDKTKESEEDSNKQQLEIPRPESHKRGSICKYEKDMFTFFIFTQTLEGFKVLIQLV